MKKVINNKGITLISLIITIVILIILAVVAIVAINDEGLFSHVEMSVTAYSKEQAREKIYLVQKEFEMKKYDPTFTTTFGEFLKEQLDEDDISISYDETKNTHIVEIRDYVFEVTENEIIDITENEHKTVPEVVQIPGNNLVHKIKYYCSTHNSYDCQSSVERLHVSQRISNYYEVEEVCGCTWLMQKADYECEECGLIYSREECSNPNCWAR